MQIVVNNNIINYEIYNSGNTEKYLLILPGWKRTAAEWDTTTKVFIDKYNVITLDFPGFGISPKPNTDFDIYDYATLVEDFLNKLKISKCTILGHSFGGRVAIILAATTSLCDKLILVDSAGFVTNTGLTSNKQILYRCAKTFAKFLPNRLVIKIRNISGSEDYKNAGELRNTLVKVVNQDLTHLLKDIKAATLVVWGDKDSQVGVWRTGIFRREIPNSLIRGVWGSGHSPHLEKPEKFLEVLREFI